MAALKVDSSAAVKAETMADSSDMHWAEKRAVDWAVMWVQMMAAHLAEQTADSLVLL